MYTKLIIKSNIKVLTGMHIGGSSVFSPIGAVDSPVVTDPRTHRPIIPGSSLKGKMRSLLSRSMNDGGRCKPEEDPPQVLRLFGCHTPKIILSRLQFADCPVAEASVEEFKDVGLTEVKFENTIDRLTAVANPRQMERVCAGVVFECRIAYTAESQDDLAEDMRALARAMQLLQLDYLGGHGTRGDGRISFTDLCVVDPEDSLPAETLAEIQTIFKDVADYDLLAV